MRWIDHKVGRWDTLAAKLVVNWFQHLNRHPDHVALSLELERSGRLALSLQLSACLLLFARGVVRARTLRQFSFLSSLEDPLGQRPALSLSSSRCFSWSPPLSLSGLALVASQHL